MSVVRNANRNDRLRDELETDVPLVYAEKAPARVRKGMNQKASRKGMEKGEQEVQHLFLYAVGLSSDYDAEETAVPG
jgi:hypothetical protein